MRYIFLILIILFTSFVQVFGQFFTEDFDDSTTPANIMFVNGPCNDSASDYFGIVCLNGGGCGNEIGSAVSLSGGDGGSFIGAQNYNDETDCNSSSSVTAQINSIDISGQTNMTLCFEIAEDDDGPTNQDWDATSQVRISIDLGGGSVELVDIQATGGTNTEPAFDCNSSGTGDGPIITSTFTTYCVPIIGSGVSMSILIDIEGLNAGDEDIALDNFQLYSTENGVMPPANDPCAGCGISSFGPASLTCQSNVMGGENDMITVNIPYTGIENDATVSIDINTGTVGANIGDDPSLIVDGSIQFIVTEGDAYVVSITDGDSECSLTDVSGLAVATFCDLPEIVINEFIYNPCPGNDEMIELFNNSGGIVDLSGWTFEDNTGTFHIVPNGASIGIDGFYSLSIANRLNNTGDQIVLKDDLGNQVDIVSYTSISGACYNNSNGISLSLIDPDEDNSDANGSNWGPSADVNGSIGAVNVLGACIDNVSVASVCIGADLEMVIEFDYDHAYQSGIQFQIYDVLTASTIAVSESFSSTDGMNVQVLYEIANYTGSTQDFEIQVLPLGGSPRTGACSETISITPTICMIPVFTTCNDITGVIFTEIMIDPCSGSSGIWPTEGNAEYVEIYNNTGATIDISGYQIRDEQGTSSFFQFPDGTMLASGQYAVVAKTNLYQSLDANMDNVIDGGSGLIFDRLNRAAELDNNGIDGFSLYTCADTNLETPIDEVTWENPSCMTENDGITASLPLASYGSGSGDIGSAASPWMPSLISGSGVAGGGTPGEVNTLGACISNVTITGSNISGTCDGTGADGVFTLDITYDVSHSGTTDYDIIISGTAVSGLIETDIESTVSLPGTTTFSHTSSNLANVNEGIITVEVRPSGAAANSCYLVSDQLTVTTDNTCLLPVNFLSFEVKPIGKAHVLHWSTAQEIDNSHFNIEWSKDGRIYQNLGRVDGNKTTLSTSNYIFYHEKPENGMNYYRLKQYDFDGKSNYSSIRSLRFNSATIEEYVINYLVNNKLAIKYSDQKPRLCQIYNSSGRLMFNRNVQSEEDIDVRFLSGGLYFIVMMDDDKQEVIKWIKY